MAAGVAAAVEEEAEQPLIVATVGAGARVVETGLSRECPVNQYAAMLPHLVAHVKERYGFPPSTLRRSK